MKIRILKNGEYIYFEGIKLVSSGSFWSREKTAYRIELNESEEKEDVYVHDDFSEIEQFDKIEIFLNNKWIEV